MTDFAWACVMLVGVVWAFAWVKVRLAELDRGRDD